MINTVDENRLLFLESSIVLELKQRYAIGLYNDGRNYFEEIIKEYTLGKKITRRTGNSLIINRNKIIN